MEKNTQVIEVKPNVAMKKVLSNIFENNEIDTIIETGTYLGKGTTKMFIDVWGRSGPLDLCIYTIEGKKWAYDQAKENLKEYGFVQVLYGISLGFADSRSFIQKDIMLTHHERFPDILIDNTEDPKTYYLNELATMMGGKEHLLTQLITERKDDSKILFCLDSCGGLGYMEFQAVVKQMGRNGFYLFLDDINHVKHYRSFEDIKINRDKRWEVLYKTTRYALVKRNPI